MHHGQWRGAEERLVNEPVVPNSALVAVASIYSSMTHVCQRPVRVFNDHVGLDEWDVGGNCLFRSL